MKTLPSVRELKELSAKKGFGATREKLSSWGVSWPPKKGWLKGLLAQAIEREGTAILNNSEKKQKKIRHKEKLAERKRNRAARSDRRKERMNAEASIPFKQPPSQEIKTAFYASWEWRTLRMEVLKTQGTSCQCCGAKAGDRTVGGAAVRIVVDHIKPISKFWALRLDKNNLQVLCDECNMGKGAWDETDYRPGADEIPEGNIVLGDSWDEFEEQAEKLRLN
jgi:5-methylcytosine-specific restriction endonuclease McrA